MDRSFWDGVNPQSVTAAHDGFKEFSVGENIARVWKVEEKVSESGNPMLVITFQNEQGAEIRHYIADGEYKLSRLKQFYAAFGIAFGITDTRKWIGKYGIVVCKKGEPYNGHVYNKVSYLKPLDPSGGSPKHDERPHNSYPDVPQGYQFPVQTEHPSINFEDDIPF